MFEFVKNKAILEPLTEAPHAFVTYKICAKTYGPELAEEIALGQSLGAWEPRHAEVSHLAQKVAKLVRMETTSESHVATVAFPWGLWWGKLNFLLTQIFGKMSFYKNVRLWDVTFSANCFGDDKLVGPRYNTHDLRELTGAKAQTPLLMGILKPNVAMSDDVIARLYEEAASAGVHILKDDEIRHEENSHSLLSRVEKVAVVASQKKLKTLYAVHLQIDGTGEEIKLVRDLENAGASALLVNPWTSGIQHLQILRKASRLPILAHPALVGAFGIDGQTAHIHPQVTLGQFVRVAGADLSLFPSPYGKLGLAKADAMAIARACQIQSTQWLIKQTTPVPSAGIKPEHATEAKNDFGNDFVLNAGTAIFSGEGTPQDNIKKFRATLYGDK